MSQQESLPLIKRLIGIKPIKESPGKRDAQEFQGVINPIVLTVRERLLYLKEVGVTGLIDEISKIYGKEKIWEPPTPWERHSKYGARLDLDLEYSGKHSDDVYDGGSSISTIVLFSKIAKKEEPKYLLPGEMETDAQSGEGSDFASRWSLYGRASKNLNKIGLQLTVFKTVVDDRELKGFDRSSRPIPISVSLYESITRRTDFAVFESDPNEIIVCLGGFSSKERKFDLRAKSAIEDMRNYIRTIIAIGGDISAGLSHNERLAGKFEQAPRGPLLIFK